MNNLVKIGVALALSLSISYVNAADDISGERDLFSIFDENSDGLISMEEVTMGMMKIISMDKNKDHMLSRDELLSQEDYSHFMSKFDLNRDGKLSMSEIPGSMRYKLMKMDANRDGYVSIEELTGEADTWK